MAAACRDFPGGLFLCGVQHTLLPEMFILY